MGLSDVVRRPIKDVQIVGDCKVKHCKRPMVMVTFDNGKALTVHDDGSFVPWLGESNT